MSSSPPEKYFTNNNRLFSIFKREYLLVILCIICSLLFFFELGSRTFETHDVPRYAEMARDMLHSGDWLVTKYQGHIYLSKPPMLMWLIAFFSSFTDHITPLTARLPNALAGIAGVLITYYFARKFFSRRIAFLSAIILAISQKYFWHGREARTDMLFTVFVTLSFYFFYLGYRQKKWFYSIFYFALVLAVLTKGPLGIIFVLSVIIVYLALQKNLSAIKTMKWEWGVAIFALTIGIWGSIFCLKVGIKPIMSTVKSELFTRINDPISHAEPFYYYFVSVWADYAPWTLFIPFACIYTYKKWREGNPHHTFLFCWIVVIFIFLFISKAKSSRYMLPIFPALSILIANLISDVFENTILQPKWLAKVTRWIIFATAIIAAITLVGMPHYLIKNIWIGTFISIVTILMLIKLYRYFFERKKILKAALAFIIIITTAGWLVYIHQLTVQSNRDSFGPGLVKTVNEESMDWKNYIICGYQLDRDIWNIINLNLNTCVPRLTDQSELRQFLNSVDAKPICIIEKVVFDKIKENILDDSLKTIDIKSRKHPLVVLTKK